MSRASIVLASSTRKEKETKERELVKNIREICNHGLSNTVDGLKGNSVAIPLKHDAVDAVDACRQLPFRSSHRMNKGKKAHPVTKSTLVKHPLNFTYAACCFLEKLSFAQYMQRAKRAKRAERAESGNRYVCATKIMYIKKNGASSGDKAGGTGANELKFSHAAQDIRQHKTTLHLHEVYKGAAPSVCRHQILPLLTDSSSRLKTRNTKLSSTRSK